MTDIETVDSEEKIMIEDISQNFAQKPISELLELLLDEGFSKRDIARTFQVTISTLNKWRNGHDSTNLNHFQAVKLLTICHFLENEAGVVDSVSFLETPIIDNVPVTKLDLYIANRLDLLFRLAFEEGCDPELIMDQYELDWRTKYHSEFEIFEAEDGERSIRAKI